MGKVEIFNKINGLMDSYRTDSSFQKHINQKRQIKLSTVCDFLMTLANSYPNKDVILNMPELMASIQFIRDEVTDDGIKNLEKNEETMPILSII